MSSLYVPRRYYAVPAGPDESGQQELYAIGYVDEKEGFVAGVKNFAPRPLPQAKELARQMTLLVLQNGKAYLEKRG